MSESNEEFIARLQQQDEERRANAGQDFAPAVIFKPEPNVLYRFTVDDAWSATGGEYDDSLGLHFVEDSPVTKGFKSKGENTLYFNRGIARTIRSIVFRDFVDNPEKDVIKVGVSPKDKSDITIGVPKIDEPVNVQFVIIQDEPKSKDRSGFKHSIGEVVDSFPGKWEDPTKFVERLQKEKAEYLKEKFADNQVDGNRLGHTELGVGKVITMHVEDVFPSKDGTFGIVKINPEKSPLWDGYSVDENGVFNRAHMNGPTLKTFRNGVLNAIKEDKDATAAVFVGKRKDKDGNEVDDFIKMPKIPEGGVTVRFFREERYPLGPDGKPNKDANPYKICLGEILEE